MYHPVVKGTYYEMGKKYGAILYKHGFRIQEQSAEKLEFGKKSEKELERVFPEVLEEMRGFAEACHSSHEDMTAFMLGIGAFKVEPMCSIFAASSNRDVVFGRNHDFFYSFKKYTESYLTCPEDGYISLGHSDVFIGREDGVNEKGLTIGMTGVPDIIIKPGVNFPLMTRYVLDKCASVEEAIKALSDAHFSSNSNYLLADRSGDLAVVEASPKKTLVRHAEKGDDFIVCTNHFVHPEMQEMEDQKALSGSEWDTLPRYRAISNALKEHKSNVDVQTGEKILSDHGGYVCSHQRKIKLGTIWSVVATLKEPRIFRAEGHPCNTRFKEDTRLTKAILRRRAK